mmetsp:Transcript_1910/g.1709  ORF Transcript_1910/g.1709 Transcript_1910/m.1709 type:complete len:333 (+) Transcript_1910:308-1306(+)
MVAGTGLTMIFSMWTLILGRFICGMGIGMYVTICPLFISEYSPASLSGPLGSINQMNVVTGLVLAFSLAFILPLPDDAEAKTTGIWRILLMIPGIIGLLQFVLLTLVFKYDTPLFYKKKGDLVNYNKVMSLAYHNYKEAKVLPTPENKSEIEEEKDQEPNIYEESQEEDLEGGDEESKSNKDSTQKSRDEVEEAKEEIGESKEEVDNKRSLEKQKDDPNNSNLNLKNSKTSSDRNQNPEIKSNKWPTHYKKALSVCIMLSIFHQTTGINGVTFFSNEIFTDGEEGNSAERKARLGTFFFGIAAFTGTAISVFLFKIFKRKTFFIGSELAMMV